MAKYSWKTGLPKGSRFKSDYELYIEDWEKAIDKTSGSIANADLIETIPSATSLTTASTDR